MQIRQKSVEMLVNALRIRELPDGTHDPDELASRIEAKMFETYNGVTEKYKSALRSRVFNLRDKKNLALRENVLTGAIKPEKFAVMTADEMASDEMKSMREAFTKEGISEHQMSVNEGNRTPRLLSRELNNTCSHNLYKLHFTTQFFIT